MQKLISIIILLTVAFFGCKQSTEPQQPAKQNPPGYQEDIPWSSLADSPWPMFHGDAQLTGRSKYTGPSQGIISKIVEANQMEAGISIGYDSTFYFTAQGKLVSADYNGNRKWEILLASEITTTPLIGKDSTIYITTSSLRSVYAIKNDGNIKWKYESDVEIWNASLSMDLDGNIYFITNSTLTVLSPEGKKLWELYDSRFLGGLDNVSSFSPDGKTLYLQGNSVSLLAVDIISHQVRWTFGNRMLCSGAVVDNDGNIYIFPNSISNEENYFYSLTPSGEVRWKFKHDENDFRLDNVEPAIDKEGNIYFGFHNLYSLDYSGKLRWKINLGEYSIGTSILVDNIGNVFLGTSNVYLIKILSFNKNGIKRWEIEINDERSPEASMAIRDDGSLLFPTFRSQNLYIIK